MIITVKKTNDSALVTIDTESVLTPFEIRNALMLALNLDGFSDETIRRVFNIPITEIPA